MFKWAVFKIKNKLWNYEYKIYCFVEGSNGSPENLRDDKYVSVLDHTIIGT